ncbi:MAG: rhodanese-like domain-containing protein [Muribaculaceae bacterium]|nr:rhodanese-like domain-containing protein [Muribaculaceae bacterium]
MTLLMINVKTLLLLAIVVIIAVSCATTMTKRNLPAKTVASWADVGVEEFQTLIADPNVQLLDVRTQEEFDEGHISGATLVDVNDSTFIEKAMGVLDVQRPVAVYCRSGRRSARAASQLAANGLTVTNLNGGVIAWQDQGKSLVK